MVELNAQNFGREVLEENQLVLVDFWRPGCRACLRIEPIIEEVAREFEGRVKVGKLNVFENPEITKAFRIPATPTLIIFKNGKPIEKAVGIRPKQVLVQKLDSLLI